MEKNKVIEVGKKERLDQISRIAVLCIACCILMGGMLALYQNFIPGILESLQEEGNMDQTEWFVRYASLIPPVILIAILITAVYYSEKKYVLVRTQHDKAIIVGVAFAFTYVVLLGSTILSSPGWNDPASELDEGVKSAIEICAPWFAAQVVPFMILLSYHLVRASTEKKELIENEE